MAIAASSGTPTNSLEDFRIEFNNLVTDVTGITSTNTFSTAIVFEGATADAYETTLTVVDPTADRTWTLPNVTDTVVGKATTDTLTNITLTRPVLNTATVGTSLSPASANGAALGTTSLEWSDAYFADGAVVYFGADQDITLTHNADTGLTLNGVMVATTVEPTGDTSTGDNAALGYTSVLGAILTGQGSTNDVTLVNDADATVLSIPTGTTNVTIAGVVTSSGFTIGSAAILEAELEILDGANVTTTELNLLDGSAKSTSSITLADADAVIVIDGTTTKQIPASDFLSYTSGDATALAIALG